MSEISAKADDLFTCFCSAFVAECEFGEVICSGEQYELYIAKQQDLKEAERNLVDYIAALEAEVAALKPYRDGYDPATVFPPEGVWVWLRDCDDNLEIVQYNPNAGFYWNYSPNADGERFSYWEANNGDLIRWYPEPPKPEVEE